MDECGNYPSNLHCECGVASKTQLAGREMRVPGGLFFMCRLAGCACFYRELVRKGGGQVRVGGLMGR